MQKLIQSARKYSRFTNSLDSRKSAQIQRRKIHTFSTQEVHLTYAGIEFQLPGGADLEILLIKEDIEMRL